MPSAPRSRTNRALERRLDLPPGFRLVTLRESGNAFAHACQHAPTLAAGALVFLGRFDLAEFAVVLEPDEPLAIARRAFYAGMTALLETLAALAPPETPIDVEWPDAVRIDGGLIGGGRLGWPVKTAEDTRPNWLVFGVMIRTVALGERETGLHPLATALEAEGFGEYGAERLAEGFARHLMAAVDRLQECGFAAIAGSYAARLKTVRGAWLEIAESGDLRIVRPGQAADVRPLVPALRAPSWLDPVTGGPRL